MTQMTLLQDTEKIVKETKDNTHEKALEYNRLRDMILKETADRILYLIRLGHPDEHNEPYSRWFMLDFLSEKGVEVMERLGWSTKEEEVYRNLHTADDSTLKQMWESRFTQEKDYYYEVWLRRNAWGIMEHWAPVDKWTDKYMLEGYKTPEEDRKEGKRAHNTYNITQVAETSIEGTKYFIRVEHTVDTPEGFDGSSWGISEGIDPEKAEEYFEELYQQKLAEQKAYYKEIKEELWEVDYRQASEWYRLIPMSEYRVMIDKKAKEIIEAKGFDFDKWYKKYMSIEENHSTQEYDKLVEEMGMLIKEGEKVVNENKVIRREIRDKLSGDERKVTLNNFKEEIGLDELFRRYGANLIRIKKIDGILLEEYRKAGNICHSDTFYFNCDYDLLS